MKSAVFERQQGRIEAALETVKAALVKFPKFPKLYMIQGQIYQSQKNYPAARAIYAAGMKQCPKDITLWILASRLEELDGKSIKARALLERARMVNPASEQLWAEAVGIEERSGGATQAKAMLARGTNKHRHVPRTPLTWRFLLQVYKNAPSLVCYGHCPSGPNLDRPGRHARQTPSEKQKTTRW